MYFLTGLSLRYGAYNKVLLVFMILLQTVEATSQPGNKVSILSEELIFTDAPFKQCHASTLAELKNGGIIAVWFAGSYEGSQDVCIWSSIRQKDKWSPPLRIVCGTNSDGSPLPCWNPVFFSPGDSTLILYYKQGMSPSEWHGMSISSFNSGKTWTTAVPLEGFEGPSKNKPGITGTGTWLNPASTETADRWQVYVERSTDKGKTWTTIPVDTSNPAKVIQPCLLIHKNGSIQALCRSNQDRIMESWSNDDGKTWSHLQKTDLANPNAGIDAITLHSGIQVLVFNPQHSGKDWWSGRNILSIATSADGYSWTVIYDLEDQPSGEFSYPAVIQGKDGTIHVTYTYNRLNIKYIALKIQ